MGGGTYMSTREERIEVFEDTQDWISKDPDLSASVQNAKNNTTVYYEDDYPAFDATEKGPLSVAVSMDRSFQAAMRLSKEYPGAKIAVMNFANAFQAGGGVTKGSSAQEESLCRTSTLYPLLYRRMLRDTFYKHHKDLNTPKASDSLIYTEGVIICKTDEDLPQRMPKEDWVAVDVITIAAPDLRTKSNMHAALVDGGTYMNDAELFGYHVKRAIHMLTCAAAKNAEILVLGAFGCGAFENNPEVVARAYSTALQVFPKVFRHIEFAVYCTPKDTTNYDVFKRVLDTGRPEEAGDAQESSEEGRELKEAIHRFSIQRTKENLFAVLLLLKDSMIWIPCNAVLSAEDQSKWEALIKEHEGDPGSLVGKTLTNTDNIRMVPDILQNGEEFFFPVFTSVEDMGEYGDHFSKLEDTLVHAITLARNNEKDLSGIVVNAFSEPFILDTDLFNLVERMHKQGI